MTPTTDGSSAIASLPVPISDRRTAKQAKEAKEAKKDLQTSPMPIADPAMYRGVLGEIVRAAEPHTEADPVGVLVSLLAGAGTLAGHKPHLMVGSTRHPLLVWPLLFGRTGTGRKGEAGETAAMFLRGATGDEEEVERLSVSGLSSGEGLIERIRDKKDDDDKGGVDDKRLLVTEPEFATVMARAKREGSTLAAVLRQAWDGRALSVLNRTALRASSSHVSIAGHVTPREFRLRLAETEMSGGTYNRFLPVFVDRSKRLPMPEPLDPDTLAALTERMKRSIAAATQVGRLTLDRGAIALWRDELYDEFTAADDEDAAWTEFTRRAAPYTLRIGGLFAALAGRSDVAADDLHAAAALVRYSIDSAKFVLDGQGRDARMDRIRRALDSKPEGLTRSDVSGLFSRKLNKETLDELLERLVKGGDYTSDEVATDGRTATRYRRAGQ